ncbi:class I SAM-dependent methyltransferase [Pseudorhodobacter sp.]|uniref:class I SAM-dependent methyltransferase n=1 Tax=Pseudorhodobacter sp. TaxID=1934400 RepID=UPI002648D3EA|nr:methyltransferase type 12 [Pseudorhodobacter sp.]MDN5787899.1 methyltransferase type 12 [Pseudorhodobacter sp.]
MLSDFALFLKQAVLQPKQTSSLVPSSRALALAMASHVGPLTGPVVEFGPGTGKITQAILDRGVAPADLTLYEMNPVFAEQLHRHFAGVTIHTAPAQDAANRMAPTVGAVISGLPLLSMPRLLRRDIIAAAFRIMRPDGIFVQFTYGANSPLTPEGQAILGLRVEKAQKVWGNLPPAQVYLMRRANV